MNAEINCIRAVAVSLLPVTPYTTFRINFSSGRKGRFIDGNWVLLSRLSRRRDAAIAARLSSLGLPPGSNSSRRCRAGL